LRYVTDLANLKYKVERYAVCDRSRGARNIATLITKEYKVRPGFITRWQAAAVRERMRSRRPLRLMPPKAAVPSLAGWMPRISDCLRRQLPAGSHRDVFLDEQPLDRAQHAGESGPHRHARRGGLRQRPGQVEIESKFVEITQNNLKELSFDWLLGQFNITSKDGIFAAAGPPGHLQRWINSITLPDSEWSLHDLSGHCGNRSGGLAISQNAIDSLLFGTAGASKLRPPLPASPGS
jgi:general secretion pathway protein D